MKLVLEVGLNTKTLKPQVKTNKHAFKNFSTKYLCTKLLAMQGWQVNNMLLITTFYLTC